MGLIYNFFILQEHGTLHTGVKPHRCPICGREIRVKSNLYKHMKIHKKNAELGITSGRGRHHNSPQTPNSTSPSTSSNSGSTPIRTAQPTKKSAIHLTPVVNSIIKVEVPETHKQKVKQIKVEDRILEVKQEPMIQTHCFQPSSTSASRISMNNGTITASPMQGATALDVVVENELAGGGTEHRGPIVVSIVTDGLGGSATNILQNMDPEQQAQLFSAVTSLANAQGHTVTVAAAPGHGSSAGTTTFIASPLQTSTAVAASATSSSNSSSTSGTQQDPILGVSNTQYYTNTQQFFTSLDQLQN